MSVEGLERLFRPASVAVVGASDRPHAVGQMVMRNLLEGRFPGPVMPVNPRRKAVGGVLAYATVEDLPTAPDLALLCTPADTLSPLVEALGARGCGAAVVVAPDAPQAELAQAAARHGMRLLGAGSLGLLAPRSNLNASFSHVAAAPGKVGFVSQSNALCAAVLDWAADRGIGFSHFVSLGDCLDVDFADMLDYLAQDDDTRAILLYVESITERRDFMPAARAAARNKPVLLVKAGKGGGEQTLSASQSAFLSEELASPDEVFDAAVRRSGALRVADIDELFAAVETLARAKPARGRRLAVMSNGGGTAMMAVDEMAGGGAELAPLSEATLAKLAAALPRSWRPGNPVDLAVDATGRRYADALKTLVESDEADAVLVMHAPNAMADGAEVARAVIDAQRAVGGAVFTSWIGRRAAEPARRLFAEAGLPSYETPGGAVRGFRHLQDYRRNQDMLLETPPAALLDFRPALGTARLIVERALSSPGGLMAEPDAKAMLKAYGIPVVDSVLAADADGAAEVAGKMGCPVALTLASPDIPRKWDVGGVALNLENAEAVLQAARAMLRRAADKRPDARLAGFTVQPMAFRPHARQLLIGIACDALFGPVLVFGEGGRAVEIVRDHTIGLPPLNLPLAQGMIERARVSRLLEAHGARPAADRGKLAEALVRLSQMLVDNPEIVACDVNPLFADEDGVLAVDARMRVAPPDGSDRRRLAIRPYPVRLEEPVALADGSVALLRPIRPEDEPAHAELVARMTPQDLRYRFFGHVRELRHAQLAPLTQIDYDREMAFIATRPGPGGRPETLGVVRTVTDPDNRRAELAILVRSDLKGTGLGRLLMDKIVRYTRARGTGAIVAQVLAENAAMLKLARKSGFTLKPAPDDPEVVECVLVVD